VKRIFLTGATGTIGSALVARLLRDEGAHLTLLIRAPDDDTLRARLQAMLAFWQLPAGDARPSRIDAVRGDIALPGFGLTDDRLERLASTSTHIIHCAASVKLNMTLDQARATAVTPTRTVLEFGRRGARAGVLRKIDLVSTVGVWGRTPGVMPERAARGDRLPQYLRGRQGRGRGRGVGRGCRLASHRAPAQHGGGRNRHRAHDPLPGLLPPV